MMTAEEIRDRLQTIVDEAWGLQPELPVAELITMLEQKIFQGRVHTGNLHQDVKHLRVVLLAARRGLESVVGVTGISSERAWSVIAEIDRAMAGTRAGED